MDHTIHQLAQKIWDYHHMHQELKKADCILVLGSHDTRVAEYSAELFLAEWAPIIIFSGGVAHQGDLLETKWEQREAEVFAKIAIDKGIPKDKILMETSAQNTGENILFSRTLLQAKGISPKSIILVQKPYMERRAYATFKQVWPEPEVIVTSPQIAFAEYSTKAISEDMLINLIVGDLERIKVYGEKGFQIPQEIPLDVWGAYEELVKAGYTKHLIK